jgi:hypothetical protein
VLLTSLSLKKTADENLIVPLSTTDGESDLITVTTDHSSATITTTTSAPTIYNLQYDGPDPTNVTIKLRDVCGGATDYVVSIGIVPCQCTAPGEVCHPSTPSGSGVYTCACPTGFQVGTAGDTVKVAIVRSLLPTIFLMFLYVIDHTISYPYQERKKSLNRLDFF